MSEETRVEIPAPKFEIFETVEPTPDRAIKPASPVGKIEHRAWVEYDQRPGYWRYTVRWPGGGTSSESDEHLQTADRLMCDLKVVVSGAPFKFESWTTESVDVLIERALEKAGVAIRPDEWTLRTAEGAELKHLVGDAQLVDGETVLFLDPQVGGGGDSAPDGWQGTPPAEDTRRKLIVDRILVHPARLTSGHGGMLAPGNALDLADEIESALLKSTIAKEAKDNARIAELKADLAEEQRIHRQDVEELKSQRPRGNVPPGTKELHVVLANRTDDPREFFVELEDQDGCGLGGFESRQGDPGTRRIVIPYGRDDAWVSEVAYQAAGAATRPLLEDHPDYVFPAERVREAVAYLLETFGIPRSSYHGCQEEQLEHGAKEAAKPDGTRADGLVDMRPPDEWDVGQAARERLYERLTDGPVPNCAELARVIDILR